MTTYDERARAQAARMLAPKAQGGKGQTVTLHQPATDGVTDPATDTVTGASPAQDHEGSGVETQYSAFSVASGVVAAGDEKLLLSPLKSDGSAMPEPVADSWTLTKGGKVWTIKRVEAVRPAGLAAMYKLQIRGVA